MGRAHACGGDPNDISRQDPELVVATATQWLAAPDDSTGRVVRHGLRTLVKRGHPGALQLQGFTPARLDVTGPLLAADTVAIGETRTLEPGETCELRREHSFKVLTTRCYHPGQHALELQINGVRSGRAEFVLLTA